MVGLVDINPLHGENRQQENLDHGNQANLRLSGH